MRMSSSPVLRRSPLLSSGRRVFDTVTWTATHDAAIARSSNAREIMNDLEDSARTCTADRWYNSQVIVKFTDD